MKRSVVIKELLLVLTTVIWGMGFIAQFIGGSYLDAFSFNVFRNGVAALFLFIIVLIMMAVRKKKGSYQKDENRKELWIGGFLIGLALASAMTLQQLGINLEGAGKSGFLTALYIVFVPFFGLFFKKKVSIASIIAIFLSLVGIYLINTGSSGFSFSLGSIYLLGSALAYSAQIMLIDRFSKNHDSIQLSCIEFLFGTILLIPFSIFFGNASLDGILKAYPAILFLGIGSSGIAYTIQIYAQKEVNVTVACIIMSLESVFSLIFGVLILKESHTLIQYLGCLAIFIAVILSQIPSGILKKKKEKKL